MESILLQTSFIAAFIGGMVALFAPCCISFLLPAYLGNVFKEKEKVVLMTLIFGLGIFTVLMPAVLGIAALSKALFIYHDSIYYLGGLVMILSAVITFLGIKFPMPGFAMRDTRKTDPVSVFILGIFSGITSACCAPVLIGILTLTFLSGSFITALSIGAVYVLGMIFPLLIIALFLSGKIGKFSLLRKPIFTFQFFGKRMLSVSSLVASTTFFLTGVLILYLNRIGRLGMEDSTKFSKFIEAIIIQANNFIGNSFLINISFLILLLLFLVLIIKKK